MKRSHLCRSILLALICAAFSSAAAAQMECNGQAENCDRRLNEVAFAGTHNSAAGYRGVLYYETGIPALSNHYRNQMKSFTEQLEGGIRYFDIDTAYLKSEPAINKNWWRPKGAWMGHSISYAGPVKDLIDQVDEFLERPENQNEVVVIEFNNNINGDQDTKEKIVKNINDLIQDKWANKVILRDDANDRWPTLRESLNDGRQVAVLVHASLSAHIDSNDEPGFLRHVTRYHYDNNPDNWVGKPLIANIYCGRDDSPINCGITSTCSGMVTMAKQMCATDTEFVRLSVLSPKGLALGDLADLCSNQIQRTAMTCDAARKQEGSKLVPNFVMIDRFGTGGEGKDQNNIIKVVRALNSGEISNERAKLKVIFVQAFETSEKTDEVFLETSTGERFPSSGYISMKNAQLWSPEVEFEFSGSITLTLYEYDTTNDIDLLGSVTIKRSEISDTRPPRLEQFNGDGGKYGLMLRLQKLP